MIKIQTFESSSSGNLHLIETGDKKLLIECGLRFKKIKQYLDFDLNLSGCLLSHCHLDHSYSAKHIMKAGINLYCSKETAGYLKLKSHRLKVIEPCSFMVDGFKCFAFKTNHDTPGALGFLIDIEDSRILFATDTGSMPYNFPGLTNIMIECNYSERSMQDLDPLFIKRVHNTHMGLDDTLKFLKRNDLSKVQEIRLIHLSSRNADADYFKSEIAKLTGKPVVIS